MTRGGADEREMVEVDLDRACRRTFIDHDVDAIVLHRGVEVLLDDRTQTMDLIDKKDVVRFEGGHI